MQSGLIITHNLMTFVTAIIAIIYLCVNITMLKDKEILKKLALNIVLILCISAFFWLPMLETYNYAEYEVYQKDSMATKESFESSGLNIWELLFTSRDSTYIFEIGPYILIMICLSIIAIKKVKSEYKKEYILFLILGIITTLMSVIPLGPFNSIFQITQFKWRMLLFSNFFFAIICGINMNIIIKNFGIKDVIVLSTIGTLYTITLVSFVPINSEIKEIDNYTIGKITDDKRDVIVGMGRGEYLTTKSNNNREYLNTRGDNVEIIKGRGNIENYNKKGQYLTCTVQIFEEETTLEFPYIYYPGYEIKVNGEKASSFESENGFLAITVKPNQKVDITVKYVGTTIMLVSKIISIIGIIMSKTETSPIGHFRKEKKYE